MLGFGYVTYTSSKTVDRFMAARPHRIHSREIVVKRAIPKLTMKKSETIITSKRLFVSNIREATISEHDLNEYFAKVCSDFQRMFIISFNYSMEILSMLN